MAKSKRNKKKVASIETDIEAVAPEEIDVISVSEIAEEQDELSLDSAETLMESQDEAVSEAEIEESMDESVDDLGEADPTAVDFAAEVSDEFVPELSASEADELASYQAEGAEPTLEVESTRVISIIESLLFATDKPLSLELIRQAFKGTTVKTPQIRKALEEYKVQLADNHRGVQLEEAGGGFQLRTRTDNVDFLRRSVKNRVFRLSGPALEVLAIIAYKQPVIKAQIDEIRGVDSGHLMRALMDRTLVHFAGKSDFPGRPMFYETTRKFLEIFGLRNLKELPSPSEIDELIPDGIGEPNEEERNLGALTHTLSLEAGATYSEGESDLLKISDELAGIKTTTDFFEKEQARQKAERDKNRAQDIRDAIIMGQATDPKDVRWLERYEKNLAAAAADEAIAAGALESPQAEPAADLETVEALVDEHGPVIEAIEAASEDAPSALETEPEVSADAQAAFDSEVDGVDIDTTREPAGELESSENIDDLINE